MRFKGKYIDFAFVVPLEEELQALVDVFGYEADLSIDDFQITELASPNAAIRICLIKQHNMGQSAARSACDHLLSHYRIGIVCSFGIAGALSTDLQLGDVCISQTVYDLTDNAKYADLDEQMDLQFSPKTFHVARALCSRLAFLTQNPALLGAKTAWLSECQSFFEHLPPDMSSLLSDAVYPNLTTPRVYYGPIVSSSVSASDSLKDRIRLIDRKVLAIETEASGIFEIVERRAETLCLSIRAVSDHADPNKAELEKATSNYIRSIAARNAASYLLHQFSNTHFLSYLSGRKLEAASPTSAPYSDVEDTIDVLLARAEASIEANLRESCPAYRTKAKGYVLPPPRITPAKSNQALDNGADPSIQEISAAIEEFDRILISVEFTYPDDALCWVIADHIMRTNGDRLFVPTVIQGRDVKVGQFALEKQEAVLNENATPVVILDNPDVRSQRHAKFLIEEANRHPEVKFIIVSKDNKFTVDAGDFLSLFDCHVFHSASFSLTSLSNFISSNFDMLPQQADYAAVRLWEVFEKFNMHAHPSYFAGISQDVLYALLNANRRGELIQLAVEGALMLVVATDKDMSDSSDVAVSRTFRKKFLTDLVVCQELLKEPVNEKKAVLMAEDLAKKYDLDISPSRFVGAFIDIGLLSFTDGRVAFSASYVRDYLLAEFLSSDPQEARSYFDLSQDVVDLNVMDIYAELGPDEELISKSIALMESALDLLNEKRKSTRGILLQDRVQPRMLAHPARARAKRRAVEQAVQYVGKNDFDLERKQNILDFRNTITNRVVEYKHEIKQSSAEDIIPIHQILLHWRAGCTLLNGGAEQIESKPKRRLAGLLIRLGNRLAEVLTADLEGIDFSELKKSVMEDESYRDLESKLDKSEQHRLREDLQKVIDLLEYELSAMAYRAVLYTLCGTGWENTLRLSVRECELEEPFDELTRAVWVSDLQPESASEVCKAAFVDLGTARMVRSLLADHFVARVYWDKWKREDRRRILDLAAEIIGPLGVSLKKAEISKAARISERKKRKKRRAKRSRG